MNPIGVIERILTGGKSGDIYPGINVEAARKQFFGTDEERSTNQDIIDHFTFSGRDRQMQIGELPRTANSPTPDPETDPKNYSQDEAGINQYYADLLAAQQQAAAQASAAKAEEERLAREEEARVRDYNRGFLGDRKTELEELLGRTGTLEKQGLDKILRAYDDEKTRAENDKTKQMGDYSDLETEQGTNKVSSFEKLNQGANQAYRSLAQIIGRGAGTGSSAFRDLLPNAIGNQVSSGREGVLQDYGQNMQKIGKSKKEYESSFEEVLRDLLNQKTASEGSFKSGLDTERQNVNLQLMEVLRQNQLNEDPKSKYETVRAAIEPYKAANTKLSNNIDNYYEQYKPTMTPKAAVINKPDLGQFTVDRANINAQNQGIVDNPYASLLRKRLEER